MLTWQEQGACRDLSPSQKSVFFPEKNRKRDVNKAKEICKKCPVRGLCLQFALSDEDIVGIWGGTTDQERSVMTALFGPGLASTMTALAKQAGQQDR